MRPSFEAPPSGSPDGRSEKDPTGSSAAGGRTRVLAVLGGICSGKSAAAQLLAGEDGRVLSADAMAHEALGHPQVVARVRERFGEAAIGPDGQVDRAKLASLVFDPVAGPAARSDLEGWIHPLVRARILERLRDARAADVPRVVLDVPLLLENDAEHGFARLCHALIFVDAADEVRDRRAREFRGWAPGEVARREATQMPLEDKQRRADFVLSNHGTHEELVRAVESLRSAWDVV